MKSRDRVEVKEGVPEAGSPYRIFWRRSRNPVALSRIFLYRFE
jgi:hypothetical protein